MFETINLVDIIQSIGVLATIAFSAIGVVQSARASKNAKEADCIANEANVLAMESNKFANIANEKAENANCIAAKALNDSQKDYMPLVRFSGDFNIVSKDIKTLRSEITFDFYNLILDLWNNDFDLREEDELYCVSIEIENCGNGIITGMEIEDFFIQSGNKVAMDIRAQEELDTMCFVQTRCKEYFVLVPEEKTYVNIIVADDIMDRYGYETLEEVQGYMKEFVNTFDNIVVSMSLKLDSLNNSSYEQEFLMGTYLHGTIVHNSFTRISLKENYENSKLFR